MLPVLPPLGPRQGSAAWMVTLTDLIALLLTFFVLLFAISTPREGRLRAIAQGLAGLPTAPVTGSAPVQTNVDLARMEDGQPPAYLLSVMRRVLADDPLLARAEVSERGTDLVVAVPLERPGLLPSPAALGGLATVLDRMRNRVSVVAATGRGGWAESLADAERLDAAFRAAGLSATLPVLAAWPERGMADARPRFEIVIAERIEPKRAGGGR